VICPICQKRKAARFCPAKAEKICAVCCGTERELTIDCPPGCAYLVAAHRYENDHPRALPADTALLDARIQQDTIQVHGRFLSALAFTIAKFCAGQPSTADPDVLAALRALAESYKTLASGIVYEQPPAGLVQRELYDALSAFALQSKQKAAPPSPGPIRDSEIFQLLVFLFRMGLLRSNGRPRSRRFIEFLRSQFPAIPELHREQSHIIVP
jgi:hypothetical protein